MSKRLTTHKFTKLLWRQFAATLIVFKTFLWLLLFGSFLLFPLHFLQTLSECNKTPHTISMSPDLTSPETIIIYLIQAGSVLRLAASNGVGKFSILTEGFVLSVDPDWSEFELGKFCHNVLDEFLFDEFVGSGSSGCRNGGADCWTFGFVHVFQPGSKEDTQCN